MDSNVLLIHPDPVYYVLNLSVTPCNQMSLHPRPNSLLLNVLRRHRDVTLDCHTEDCHIEKIFFSVHLSLGRMSSYLTDVYSLEGRDLTSSSPIYR